MAEDRHPYTDEQLETGKRKLAKFAYWLRDNPRAYSFGERFALDALEASQHVGGRAIVEHIRQHNLTAESGEPTRTNNDFAAIVARRFLREHPQYAGRMKLRPCVFDVLMCEGGTTGGEVR